MNGGDAETNGNAVGIFKPSNACLCALLAEGENSPNEFSYFHHPVQNHYNVVIYHFTM